LALDNLQSGNPITKKWIIEALTECVLNKGSTGMKEEIRSVIEGSEEISKDALQKIYYKYC